MHENRETSGAPRPERERGRSAKVQNHNADTHAPEESDRTILSMNQTNKEERSSAEPGEKRVRAKENIVQPNTQPTQCGERVSQGLDGVREAAKKRRQERFTALLHHMSADLLLDSYYALKRQAAPGVDGVTWQEYQIGFELALTSDLIIADKLARFCFPELRLGLIPGGGGIPRLKRGLGNGMVRDLILTGRSMNADRAFSVGLVSQVTAPGEALTVARLTAAQVTKVDAAARIAAKKLIKTIPHDELRHEIDIFCELFSRPAVMDGLRKFVESTNVMPYLP